MPRPLNEAVVAMRLATPQAIREELERLHLARGGFIPPSEHLVPGSPLHQAALERESEDAAQRNNPS